MEKADETGITSDLRTALHEGASIRSPLFIWMLRDHDTLVETFTEARPNWTRVTELLMSKGFSGIDGKPLNPQSVRQLWYRVRQRHAAIQAGKPSRPALPIEEDALSAAHSPAKEEPAAAGEGAADALARLRAEMNKRSGRG